jgi:hypothetical protein
LSAGFLFLLVHAHGTPALTAELARKTVFAVVFFTAFGRFLRDIHFPVQPFDRFEGHVPAPFLDKIFNKPYLYRY